MTVVNSKEFSTHQRKYYKLAVNERVAIKRGKNLFHLTRANNDDENDYLEPDEDLKNAVSMEEVREKIHGVIHRLFANQ